MTDWWVSSEKMTVRVTTDENGTIRSTAPIARRFVGRPGVNLKRWMEGQGGFRYERLPGAEKRDA